MSGKFLTFAQLKPVKGIPFTRQHISRLQRQRRFPLYVALGDNTNVLLEDEIDAYLADRIAEREAKLTASIAEQEARQEAKAGAISEDA
jgi:prophage regulatory protein